MSSTPEKMQGSMQTKLTTKADEMVVQVQSPDGDEAHMDREGADAQAQGLGYEFEVKEQDRWLPIANGAYTLPCPLLLFDLCRPPLPSACRRIVSGCLHTLQSRACRASASIRCSLYPERATQSRRVPDQPAALQRAPCRPRLHIPPRPRHKQPPRPPSTMPLLQTLTFVTLLQLPAS
jgi:hypothetical protein